ncbi:MAG TPA: fatty acid--CoA ligase family protein [Actinomycetota bacterium]|nr:fatty acid--CoA ligase family protein [Actinomycetota bacterium]
MTRLDGAALGDGDLVAVALPPGLEWLDLVREVWDAGAALLPVDHRLPDGEARSLLHRARPTVVLSPDGWERRVDGVPAEADVALVVSTSGTGGEAKLVQFDRAAIDAAVAASALALGATPHDRWLCCLPLAHVGGLLVLLRGVLLGAPVTVHRGFDASAVAAERGVAFTSVVPTMLVRLLDAGVDLSGYRAILVGGAHLPLDVRDRARAAGARLVETYGSTESCGGVVYEGLPLPGVQMRIDAEGGIELSGPMLMRGYRFDVEGTARALTPDGWLRPGDAGEIDPDGRLHVIGRVDDLINSGGEKVWPREVEAVLRTHPKVAEVLVRGRLDPEWGQRVVAWVVPTDPEDPPTLEEIRTHAARRLPRHKAPRELVLIEALPQTAVGKPRAAGLPARE